MRRSQVRLLFPAPVPERPALAGRSSFPAPAADQSQLARSAAVILPASWMNETTDGHGEDDRQGTDRLCLRRMRRRVQQVAGPVRRMPGVEFALPDRA